MRDTTKAIKLLNKQRTREQTLSVLDEAIQVIRSKMNSIQSVKYTSQPKSINNFKKSEIEKNIVLLESLEFRRQRIELEDFHVNLALQTLNPVEVDVISTFYIKKTHFTKCRILEDLAKKYRVSESTIKRIRKLSLEKFYIEFTNSEIL